MSDGLVADGLVSQDGERIALTEEEFSRLDEYHNSALELLSP